ncbi:response regulator [Litoreibacter roseus]|uniref:Two-component response regulator n=1 Tax=Litoreibacter roseus TaxID=2601869 RepID=A0A6N6JIB9_9RHOB|nr:response regulator [Litoreibacter roseus]GFE66113.1 two-component response regulator [Litoreibacter roseus]
MSDTANSPKLSAQIAEHLPFLRRYARALTGSQRSGDNYAAATLEAILQDTSIFDAGQSVRVTLFRCFHTIWRSAGAVVSEEESGLAARAQKHLATLTTNAREALLLRTVEEFSVEEIAQIMETDTNEVELLLSAAETEMQDNVSGRILIIEDEAVIAMDLEAMVSDVGHRVTGVARTHENAVAIGKAERPDLILADIQLADNSSGIDAVQDLLAHFGDIPVIFITAFPERLLTGEKPEPAFLISKPFKDYQVRSAISQAMFFSSTETLTA